MTLPAVVVPPRQAALGDLGADPGRGEERRDPGAARAHPLGQRALRRQLDLELAGQVLAGELLVLPDVRRDHPPRSASRRAARPRPQSSTAAVVRDRLEVVDAGVEQRVDQHRRDPAQTETAHRQRRAVGMSATASAALATTLSNVDTSVQRSCHDRAGARGHPWSDATRGLGSPPCQRHRRAAPRRARTTRDWLGRPAAHRHRQGRHRQDDGRGRPGPGAAVARARPCCCARSRAGRASPRSSTSPPLPYEERRIARGTGAERRRRLRAGDRRRVGAAGVPRHVLPPRPGRQGARQVRRHRLRHHDRAGRARRAADRQGLRGGQPQPAATRAPATYDAVVLDAPPTGRIAQFLNVNNEVAGLAKVGPIKSQADTVMTLLHSDAYGGPPGHRAGGDAGAGDRGRRRRAARGRPAGRRRGRQHGPPAGPRRRRARSSCSTAPSTAASWSASLTKAGIAGDDALVDGAARRGPPTTPSGVASRTASERWSRRSTSRRTSCRCCGRGRPRRSLRARRVICRPGARMSQTPTRTTSTRASARIGPMVATHDPTPVLDVDALLDDPTAHHRVLRLRRRRQDHDLRGAGAARGRARPQGRRAHHRPGPPAGAVDGHRARQHPAPGARGRRDGRRQSLDAMMLDMKRTFDEVVAEPRQPGEGRADPREPVLRRRVELVRGHPGVHGDGEARPARQGRATTGRWDLIVVDTPPSRSALDFLDAPERLSHFLDGRFIEAAAGAGARDRPG